MRTECPKVKSGAVHAKSCLKEPASLENVILDASLGPTCDMETKVLFDSRVFCKEYTNDKINWCDVSS